MEVNSIETVTPKHQDEPYAASRGKFSWREPEPMGFILGSTNVMAIHLTVVEMLQGNIACVDTLVRAWVSKAAITPCTCIPLGPATTTPSAKPCHCQMSTDRRQYVHIESSIQGLCLHHTVLNQQSSPSPHLLPSSSRSKHRTWLHWSLHKTT